MKSLFAHTMIMIKRFKAWFFFAMIIAVTLSLPLSAQAATQVWDGGAGNWTDLNWNYGQPWINGYNAVINEGTVSLVTNVTPTSTTINGGTLQIGNGGATGSLGTNAVVDNANLVYNVSGDIGLPSSLTGFGNLSVTTAGGIVTFGGNIITLGGSQTYVTANGYTSAGLRINSNGSFDKTLTASAITITGLVGALNDGGRTLTLNTSAANGPITLDMQNGAAGRLYGVAINANTGIGTLTIAGNRAGNNGGASGGWPTTTIRGALNISSSFGVGTLSLTATAPSTVSGNLALSTVANTFTCDPGVTMTISGILSGAGAAITKAGAGILTLLATNTYTGATTVSNGVLLAHGVITNSDITVVSGGTLGGTGNVGRVTVNTGGAITANGTNTIGTLSATNLTVSENAIVYWNYDATVGTADVINVTGPLILPTKVTVNISGTGNLQSFGFVRVFSSTLPLEGASDLSGWSVTGSGAGSKTVVLRMGNDVCLKTTFGTVITVR